MTQRLEPKYIKRIRKLLSPDGFETGEWTDKTVKIKSTRGSVRSSGKLACVEVYFCGDCIAKIEPVGSWMIETKPAGMLHFRDSGWLDAKPGTKKKSADAYMILDNIITEVVPYYAGIFRNDSGDWMASCEKDWSTDPRLEKKIARGSEWNRLPIADFCYAEGILKTTEGYNHENISCV